MPSKYIFPLLATTLLLVPSTSALDAEILNFTQFNDQQSSGKPLTSHTLIHRQVSSTDFTPTRLATLHIKRLISRSHPQNIHGYDNWIIRNERPTSCDWSGLTMPITATSLPPPNSSLVLAFILLGSGVQLYTCDAGNVKPRPVGAKALLYDATSLLNQSSHLIPQLPDMALLNIQQKSTNKTFYRRRHHNNLLANVMQTVPGKPLDKNFAVFPSQIDVLDQINRRSKDFANKFNLKPFGYHYFNARGQPVFDHFDDVGRSTESQSFNKVAQSPPEQSAFEAVKNVPWLKLSSMSNDADIYRLHTAGGDPQFNCTNGADEDILVNYSAEYWYWQSKCPY